jgi:hypothetical protein
VIGSDNLASECVECALLLGKYEAATFEQAKIHNAMDIARHLGDRLATRRLTLEAYEVTARRHTARAVLMQHRDAAHRVASLAGTGSSAAAAGNETS